jgi:hypothetical protein
MSHDDFNFEPIRGLPEALPADEHILWQGRPNSLRLAKDAWSLNWVIGYFIAPGGDPSYYRIGYDEPDVCHGAGDSVSSGRRA